MDNLSALNRMRYLAGLELVKEEAVVIEADVVVEEVLPEDAGLVGYSQVLDENGNTAVLPETTITVSSITVSDEGSITLDGDITVTGDLVEADLTKETEVPAANAPEVEVTNKAKVPGDVTSAINSRISELKAAIEQFDKKGYDDDGIKQNAVDALEQIKSNLGLEDGLVKAVVYFGTLMGPILDLLPPKLVKYLHKEEKKKD